MTDINKEIEEIEEDAPANSMGSGQVASHNNFSLGKPMNVTDRRYKKNGKTVMLKKFKSWSESVELSEDNVSIVRDIVKNKQFKTIKLKDGKVKKIEYNKFKFVPFLRDKT